MLRKESKLTREMKKIKNRPTIPRPLQKRSVSAMSSHLTSIGLDPSKAEQRAITTSKARSILNKRKRQAEAADVEMDGSEAEEETGMEIDTDQQPSSKRSRATTTTTRKDRTTNPRHPMKNRQLQGAPKAAQQEKANELRHFAQRDRNRQARAGDADRHVPDSMPKWLFTGKRKQGSTNRR